MRFTKAMNLRAGRKPEVHPALAGVVSVYTDGKLLRANIRFSETLVKSIGKVMPNGVGPENPVYLRVNQFGKKWIIVAVYFKHPLRTQQGRILAVLLSKPDWLNPK